nr:hypothetical protein [Pandoravirus belohorizontensis]
METVSSPRLWWSVSRWAAHAGRGRRIHARLCLFVETTPGALPRRSPLRRAFFSHFLFSFFSWRLSGVCPVLRGLHSAGQTSFFPSSFQARATLTLFLVGFHRSHNQKKTKKKRHKRQTTFFFF